MSKKGLFRGIAVAVIALDRVTKVLAPGLPADGVVLIPGVIGLRYAENQGIAFSLLSGHPRLLGILSLLLIASGYVWLRKKDFGTFPMIGLALMAGGAAGNMADRLDKDTSGLMMVAKNDETQAELSRMLKDREIEKHYRALAEGRMKEPEGEIDAPIDRNKKDRKKMAVDPEGRPAVTRWKVLAEGRDCTLLDVRILTGRTHQIRVHLKSIHHPICGDPLYGFEKGVKAPCLMLHAYSLSFAHPRTKEKMTFQAPLPEDFLKGLKMNGIERGNKNESMEQG